MRAKGMMTAEEVVGRYAAGYFPLYDERGRFYWERWEVRAVIPVTAEAADRARRMGRRGGKKFVIRYTTAVEEVIAILQDERVKPRTWVRGQVVAIYRALHAANLMRTVEAFDAQTGALAGAVLGVVLPGVFVAETMFSLQADASKVCLCRLVEDAFAAGQRMIDVQMPHDGVWEEEERREGKTQHPCVRLGEVTWTLPVFLRELKRAQGDAFGGTLEQWVKGAAGRTADGGVGTTV